MDWILRSPQIHSVFGSLGYAYPNGYHVNENCNATLETILQNILSEDKYLRCFRRRVSFAQNVEKDLIPLLLHCKDEKTTNLVIKVLVNLTIPVECLLVVDATNRTDLENQIIFEINNLLTTTKATFTNKNATKVLIDFMKKNIEGVDGKLSTEQCDNISNSLFLLRNILHIPDRGNIGTHPIQNQILWNIFSQSLDKVLIKLMTIPEAINWAVTMVQLIALLYKDQHASTLHKLLNVWLEASVSESSEDNESNTSNPERGSAKSSLCLTSDPISDSSENGSQKLVDGEEVFNSDSNCSDVTMTSVPEMTDAQEDSPTTTTAKETTAPGNIETNNLSGNIDCSNENVTDAKTKPSNGNGDEPSQNKEISKNAVLSDSSDCGYGTQQKNKVCISISTSEENAPFKKTVHRKPLKPNPNNDLKAPVSLENKWKKLDQRSRPNISMNFQVQLHNTPSDDDISNILKEFTIDFLLKGYNYLVETLHSQILTNMELEIETSHFFWLVTYFFKFATQIELDLEYISSVLSYDILSYFTAEGVDLCEQFELATMFDEGQTLKPVLRRLHLVVTGIREFVQAIESYAKFPHTCDKDKAFLAKLTDKMGQNKELHSLLVLLLRYYNPRYHTKQYLQDLIVTNYVLLSFLDRVLKKPGDACAVYMIEHLRQFTSPAVMQQYGILLEGYLENGEFVNDCIFTVMHHVGGELGSLASLFQPRILATFIAIWKTEFNVCDDWSDLIETVINTFIKKPQSHHCHKSFPLEMPSPDRSPHTQGGGGQASDNVDGNTHNIASGRCSEIENSSFSWRNFILPKEARDAEILKICQQLQYDKKPTAVNWLQKVILETCFAKINYEKRMMEDNANKVFEEKFNELPVMSSVAWLAFVKKQSVPLIPWNCDQAAMNKDVKFLQLVHKIGFYMPVDTGKLFIRIPNIWTSEFLYEVATMLGPVDKDKVKFSLSDISGARSLSSAQFARHDFNNEDIAMTPASPPLCTYHQINNRAPSNLSSVSTDMNDTSGNWLEIVKKSQKRKLCKKSSENTKCGENGKCDIDIRSDACFVRPRAQPGRAVAMDCNTSFRESSFSWVPESRLPPGEG